MKNHGKAYYFWMLMWTALRVLVAVVLLNIFFKWDWMGSKLDAWSKRLIAKGDAYNEKLGEFMAKPTKRYQTMIGCKNDCPNFQSETYKADSFTDPDTAILHAAMMRDYHHETWIEVVNA